jgi:serine/threonine protein kinase
MMDATGHLKLIDFGLCKRIRNSEELLVMHAAPRNKMVPELEPMSPCGSLAFVPPETLDQQGSFAGDWWGLGVIAFELLTGHFPWRNVGTDDDDALRAEIRSGKVELPDFLSPLASSLLKGLLEKVVARRLGYFTANQIKSHGFFKGLDWARAARRDYEPPFHPCRPKKYRDADGATKTRAEPVLGIGNFGKDQRDLAMEFYKRSRRGEAMTPQALAAVALPASATAEGLKRAKAYAATSPTDGGSGGFGRKGPPPPIVTREWPVFRGFQLAGERPLPGPPPTAPPPPKPATVPSAKL